MEMEFIVMAPERATLIRCAIYTRKSSEEGLEQAFNSLDAQREACLAYIESQRHEGWRALPALYDDGGYSGGTLERPALERLLADVKAGLTNRVQLAAWQPKPGPYQYVLCRAPELHDKDEHEMLHAIDEGLRKEV